LQAGIERASCSNWPLPTQVDLILTKTNLTLIQHFFPSKFQNRSCTSRCILSTHLSLDPPWTPTSSHHSQNSSYSLEQCIHDASLDSSLVPHNSHTLFVTTNTYYLLILIYFFPLLSNSILLHYTHHSNSVQCWLLVRSMVRNLD
jgi:hypothetical protein